LNLQIGISGSANCIVQGLGDSSKVGSKIKISIVGGAGRVGLPLGIALSEFHQVVIVDTAQDRVSQINARVMPFREKGAQERLEKISSSQLKAVSTNDGIKETDVCILIIGTPINPDGTPSSSSLVDLTKELTPFLSNTKLLMLRSTVYPGITKEVESVLLESGLNTKVSFCPERIAEGNALEEIAALPQIIGADDEESLEMSKKVFTGVVTNMIEVSTLEAELAKLFANSYRYVKFALANDFLRMCISNDARWELVWKALTEDYPRAKDLPKPGFAAGPCLVKDTMQLDYFDHGRFRLGKAAVEANENLVEFFVTEIEKRFSLGNKVVGILGMTFKSEVDDFRSSLSFRLKRVLEKKVAQLLCSDSVLQLDWFVDLETIKNSCDFIIVATPHDAYKGLQLGVPVLDIWRVTATKSIF